MGSSCSTDQRDAEEEWCRPRVAQSIKSQKKKKTKKKKMDHERRKHLLEALNAEAQTSELLSRIPGRICNNGSTSSACAYTQQGKKGTNQDAMVVWEHYASRKDTLLCGIFDGHGPYGHLVARRVRDTLPSKLMGMWKARMRGETIKIDDEDEDEEEEGEEYAGLDNGMHNTHHSSLGSKEQPRPSLAMKMWGECMVNAFRQMDRELRIQPTIDCFCSGTTAVILLQQGKEMIMGNLGDSRAVLATFNHPDASSALPEMRPQALHALPLTLDLKPNLPREAERIRRCKGRVFAMQDEPDVARVWLPYDNAPGLAMARAFGDFCLKEYGLISVPDITYRTLTPEDQFVILATDGIWDVMSNRQAVEVVSSAPSRVTAARLLVETAVRAWRLKYPTSKVDDCAVICLFFHREAGTTSQRSVAATTSSYYYKQEAEEDEDEEEDRGTRASTMHKQLRAPAPTPETPSPSAASAATRAGYDAEEVEARQWHVGEIEVEEAPCASEQVQRGKGSLPHRSLAEYMNQGEEEGWSALEGVVRVNSLLHLPRFKVGDSPSFRSPYDFVPH